MSVGVGLRVGTTVSSVAVTSPTPGRPDPDPIERFTAVHLHSDGTATLGDHHVADGNTSSFTDFVDRLGHSGGVRANDGSLSRAEDLVATAMECLLADAATIIHDAPYTAVATHPTDWPSSTVAVLRNALDYVGLRHVSLISDAEAAAAWFESQVAHQTGRLVAVYHIDPLGSTVTLVRSGVAAGKAFRFAEGDAPSVASQLSSALGAFGWLVSNLDALVITTDESVDPSAAQLVAQSVKSGLGVRCALAPEPHQTMVRGAALAAAAGSVDLLGSTQILPTMKSPVPKRNELDPDATVVFAKITATPPPGGQTTDAKPAGAGKDSAPSAKVAAVPAAAAAPESEEAPARSSKVTAIAAAVAVALLVGVGALVLALRDSPSASAGTQADETTQSFDRSSTAPAEPKPSTSSDAPETTEPAESPTENPTPAAEPTVVPAVPQQTWTDPTTGTSTEESSTTSSSGTSSSESSTSTTTTWSRRNQPDPSRDSGGRRDTSDTPVSPPAAPDPDPSDGDPEPPDGGGDDGGGDDGGGDTEPTTTTGSQGA